VVVEGQEAARLVGAWVSSAYLDRLRVEVVAVSEDLGSAGALRAISKRLTANDILVMFVLHTMAMLTKIACWSNLDANTLNCIPKR